MRNVALFLLIVSASLGCQKSSTSEQQINPQSVESGARQGVRPYDAESPYQFRGSIQFQWQSYTASEPWNKAVEPTKQEGLIILDKAFAKIGTASDRANFQCAYDKAKNIILTAPSAGGIPTNYPSNNYVKNCCLSCAQALGDVNGARCDIVVNRGTAFSR